MSTLPELQEQFSDIFPEHQQDLCDQLAKLDNTERMNFIVCLNKRDKQFCLAYLKCLRALQEKIAKEHVTLNFQHQHPELVIDFQQLFKKFLEWLQHACPSMYPLVLSCGSFENVDQRHWLLPTLCQFRKHLVEQHNTKLDTQGWLINQLSQLQQTGNISDVIQVNALLQGCKIDSNYIRDLLQTLDVKYNQLNQ